MIALQIFFCSRFINKKSPIWINFNQSNKNQWRCTKCGIQIVRNLRKYNYMHREGWNVVYMSIKNVIFTEKKIQKSISYSLIDECDKKPSRKSILRSKNFLYQKGIALFIHIKFNDSRLAYLCMISIIIYCYLKKSQTATIQLFVVELLKSKLIILILCNRIRYFPYSLGVLFSAQLL